MIQDDFDPYDLEPYRQIIQHLYVAENQSLHQVMRTLREKGCRASKNMFLKKIHAWGFRKHVSQKQMVLLMERIVAGSEDKSFDSNGRTIPRDEVLNYFRKRPKQFAISQQKKDIIKSTKWRVLVPPESSSLRLPDVLDLPQQFFRAISTTQRQYLSQALGGNQHPQTHAQDISADRGFLDLSYGSNLLRQGLNQLATPLLERGFRTLTMTLPKMDVHEQLKYGPQIAYLAQQILHFGVPELAETITRYIFQFFHHQLGYNHAMTQVAKFVYENRNSMETLQLGVDVAFDTTKSLVEDENLISISMLRRRISSMNVAGKPASDILKNWEDLMTSCSRLSDEHYTEILEKEQGYGFYLITHGQFAKGMSLIQKGSRYIHEKSFPKDQKSSPEDQKSSPKSQKSFLSDQTSSPEDLFLKRVIIRSCYIEAESTLRQPRYQGFEEDEISSQKRFRRVESLLKTTIQKAITWIGPDDIQTIMTAQVLGEVYEAHGHLKESQAQADFILEQLKEFKLS